MGQTALIMNNFQYNSTGVYRQWFKNPDEVLLKKGTRYRLKSIRVTNPEFAKRAPLDAFIYFSPLKGQCKEKEHSYIFTSDFEAGIKYIPDLPFKKTDSDINCVAVICTFVGHDNDLKQFIRDDDIWIEVEIIPLGTWFY